MEIWGQNRGRDGAILTPNELVLFLGVLMSVPIFVKIDQEMRPWECSQAERQTDRQADANRFYNLSRAICYSLIRLDCVTSCFHGDCETSVACVIAATASFNERRRKLMGEVEDLAFDHGDLANYVADTVTDLRSGIWQMHFKAVRLQFGNTNTMP